MTAMEKFLAWHTAHYHTAVKLLAYPSIGFGAIAILLGVQPFWLWMGITIAYIVQLRLLADIQELQDTLELYQTNSRKDRT